MDERNEWIIRNKGNMMKREWKRREERKGKKRKQIVNKDGGKERGGMEGNI